MSFNINSQSGNQIINVAGDQTVYGGQHVMIATPLDVLGTLDMLRAAVADAKLPQAKKRRARQHVEEMEDELRRPRPDKHTIGDRLKKVTEVLLAAGALVTGGTALAQAIGGLASWLGVPGNGILDLLHAAGSPGTGR